MSGGPACKIPKIEGTVDQERKRMDGQGSNVAGNLTSINVSSSLSGGIDQNAQCSINQANFYDNHHSKNNHTCFGTGDFGSGKWERLSRLQVFKGITVNAEKVTLATTEYAKLTVKISKPLNFKVEQAKQEGSQTDTEPTEKFEELEEQAVFCAVERESKKKEAPAGNFGKWYQELESDLRSDPKGSEIFKESKPNLKWDQESYVLDPKYKPYYESFFNIFEGGHVFVDKTLLLQKVLLGLSSKSVFIFARPPGFGKSFTLNMFQAYLDKNTTKLDEKNVFNSLLIGKHPDCKKHSSKYSVLRFDFKRLDKKQNLVSAVAKIFIKSLTNFNKAYCEPNFSATITELTQNPEELTNVLRDIKKKEDFVILVDDFDYPFILFEGNPDVSDLMHQAFECVHSFRLAILTEALPINYGPTLLEFDGFCGSSFPQYIGFTAMEIFLLLTAIETQCPSPDSWNVALQKYGLYKFPKNQARATDVQTEFESMASAFLALNSICKGLEWDMSILIDPTPFRGFLVKSIEATSLRGKPFFLCLGNTPGCFHSSEEASSLKCISNLKYDLSLLQNITVNLGLADYTYEPFMESLGPGKAAKEHRKWVFFPPNKAALICNKTLLPSEESEKRMKLCEYFSVGNMKDFFDELVKYIHTLRPSADESENFFRKRTFDRLVCPLINHVIKEELEMPNHSKADIVATPSRFSQQECMVTVIECKILPSQERNKTWNTRDPDVVRNLCSVMRKEAEKGAKQIFVCQYLKSMLPQKQNRVYPAKEAIACVLVFYKSYLLMAHARLSTKIEEWEDVKMECLFSHPFNEEIEDLKIRTCKR